MAPSEGYSQVTQLMSQHQELAIFRKFDHVSIQNLLYMQAEIMCLEEELDLIVKTQEEAGERPFQSRDWWSMTQPDKEGRTEQWEKVLVIRTKLEKYRKFVSHFILQISIFV